MQVPKVAIIILNWNNWKDTIECLESLYKISYLNYDIILVDNSSSDRSVEKIRSYCSGELKVESCYVDYELNGKPIELLEYTRSEIETESEDETNLLNMNSNKRIFLIKNEKNYGFAGGNNIGIRFALKKLMPDFILLLNNDTVVQKDFLDEMIKAAQADDKIGIVGPLIYYYNQQGKSSEISYAGDKTGKLSFLLPPFLLPQIYNKARKYNAPMEVIHVQGSCFLVRSEVFKKVGLLDTHFFLYGEETDFCFRTKKAEYNLIFTPSAKIWHKCGASSNRSLRVYYITRNKIWVMKKYFQRLSFFLFTLSLFMYQFWLQSAIYLLYRRSIEVFFCYVRGIYDGYFSEDKYRANENK